MRAARYHGKQDLRVEEVARLEPGPGEVRLRTAFNGICGSDLHFYYSPESSGVDFDALPQVLGHEFAGTVEALGPDVTTVRVGDRAAVFPMISCGTCASCTHGRVNTCRAVRAYGTSSPSGGLAEYAVVRSQDLHVLPASVDLELGALVEPMAVAWHAVRRSDATAGQRALVVGAGTIGIGLWFALRAHGVTDVVVTEISAERREILTRLGAVVVDPSVDGALDAVTGDGFDAAFDTAGGMSAWSDALGHLATDGVVVEVAIHGGEIALQPLRMVLDETRVVGTLAYLPDDFDDVIAAMEAGAYDTTGWVRTVDLAEVVETIAELHAGRHVKVLVQA